MPKTKFQSIVFTAIMVFCMVYCMTVYNITLKFGTLRYQVLHLALKEMWLEYVVVFCLIFFVITETANLRHWCTTVFLLAGSVSGSSWPSSASQWHSAPRCSLWDRWYAWCSGRFSKNSWLLNRNFLCTTGRTCATTICFVII